MAAKSTKKEITVEEKLENIYSLQKIDSKIDRINFIKGELPMEVQDIEDVIEGFNTRITNLSGEVKDHENEILERNRIKTESADLIEKLEKQQNKVKNNREFESLSKEIELAKLEIELSEKKVKDHTFQKTQVEEKLEDAKAKAKDLEEGLTLKKAELEVIEKETDEELKKLEADSDKAKKKVDERLLKAYNKIRKAYRNGLAVVNVDRSSCGGCFAKVPPQRQLEIRQRKKVIVCENCGRIMAYPKEVEAIDIAKAAEAPAEKPKRRSRSKRKTT